LNRIDVKIVSAEGTKGYDFILQTPMENTLQQPDLVHVDAKGFDNNIRKRIYIVYLDFHDGNGVVEMDIHDVLTEYNTSKMRSDLFDHGICDPMIFIDHQYDEQD
jgi:hypothetical protein